MISKHRAARSVARYAVDVFLVRQFACVEAPPAPHYFTHTRDLSLIHEVVSSSPE
jgi:hypothetical protein